MTTIDEVLARLENIESITRQLLDGAMINGSNIVTPGGLSDIDARLGLVTTGEFRVGVGQIGQNFTGMRIAYPGMLYDGELWNLVGVNSEVMQTGMRASDGKFIAGGGEVVLDQSGLTVGATGTQILIDAATKVLKSSNYATGVAGYQINSDGSAEFEDVIVRGEIRSAVFGYEEIQGTAGTLMITKSAGKLKTSVTTVASPTTVNIDIEDPAYGHVQLFSVDDVIRLKNGGDDSWLSISSVSDQTTFYRYVCVLESGSTATYGAGLAVVDYGTSGDGFLVLTADASNAPFYSVRYHLGSPWSSTPEIVRIGNLNGSRGYSLDLYGINIGTDITYLRWDVLNGLTVKGAIQNMKNYPYGWDVIGEIPEGDIDGSNKDFTIKYSSASIEGTQVILNGLFLKNLRFTPNHEYLAGGTGDVTTEGMGYPEADDIQNFAYTSIVGQQPVYEQEDASPPYWMTPITTFSMDNFAGDSVVMFRNGQFLVPDGVDFKARAKDIDMITAPEVGDTLVVCYPTVENPLWLYQKVPSGTMDGSNRVFTLPYKVATSGGTNELLVVLNGVKLSETTDYVVSGTTTTTITFVDGFAPEADDTLWVTYKKES